jgi:8-oxo-dGTP pyrophosphatase MutT (NUDIX family)
VALILRPVSRDTELLIIQRADYPGGHWSGHLALPGGRVDAGDQTLRDTAVREVREEVGIDLATGGRFLGWLAPVWPRSPELPRIEIVPLVVVTPPGAVARPGAEVAEAFWVSLGELERRGRSEVVRPTAPGVERQRLAYPSVQGPIWGITERILTDFLSFLRSP